MTNGSVLGGLSSNSERWMAVNDNEANIWVYLQKRFGVCWSEAEIALYLRRFKIWHNLNTWLVGTDVWQSGNENKVRTDEMVKIGLQIKANLEYVERVTTCHPQYEWFLQLRCNGCGETSPTWHDVTEDERTSHKHGRSDTNYLAKCKLCSRENSLEILQGTNGTNFPIRSISNNE